MCAIVTLVLHSILYLVSRFYLSCSILIVNHPCSVTTKCTPNITCHVKKKTLGIIGLQYVNYCHLLSDLSSKCQSFVIIFHYKIVRMQNTSSFVSIIDMDFIQISNFKSSMTILVYLFIRSVVKKNHHNDIR